MSANGTDVNADSPIIGIDLGTTNSVVAALIDGRVQVLSEDGQPLLPSVVGMTVDGKLIVGQVAKNQLVAFPDRTISSVKRRMGEAVQLSLGDQFFSPQEISAMILRRLKQRAESQLGCHVTRAVITVPAFFDENQRQATRQAGALAGLNVERIINEPTAASLVYHAGLHEQHHLIVYDLGGGTFDVSIVRIEDGVVEVLSSKGDTHLGGDDFDELLARHVAAQFTNQHGIDLMSSPTTRWRLLQACERAKCELSASLSARISEEFITNVQGKPVNLDVTVDRAEYERLIEGLIERTISCVDDAILDAGLALSQIDELILVGGSTRTPLVQRRLREEFRREPQWSVNPDLAVALGAGTQAAMQAGIDVGPVLIDVATHTLGIDAFDPRRGFGELKYVPILRRNSPLPARFEEAFRTVHDDQKTVVIGIYQGESDDLDENTRIGHLQLNGLNECRGHDGRINVRFDLTLDGTLNVTATERASGIQKSLKIHNALHDTERQRSIDEARSQLAELFEVNAGFESWVGRAETPNEDPRSAPVETETAGEVAADVRSSVSVAAGSSSEFQRVDSPQMHGLTPKLATLVDRARSLRVSLQGDDARDLDRLLDQIHQAAQTDQSSKLHALESELDDLLFYLQ